MLRKVTEIFCGSNKLFLIVSEFSYQIQTMLLNILFKQKNVLIFMFDTLQQLDSFSGTSSQLILNSFLVKKSNELFLSYGKVLTQFFLE